MSFIDKFFAALLSLVGLFFFVAMGFEIFKEVRSSGCAKEGKILIQYTCVSPEKIKFLRDLK